jgi:hypothetical protein
MSYVTIIGLSKAQSHRMNTLWGLYRRGIWGVYPLEHEANLTNLSWLKYENAIECGLIEVSCTKPAIMNVYLQGMTGSVVDAIPLMDNHLSLIATEHQVVRMADLVHRLVNIHTTTIRELPIEVLTKIIGK